MCECMASMVQFREKYLALKPKSNMKAEDVVATRESKILITNARRAGLAVEKASFNMEKQEKVPSSWRQAWASCLKGQESMNKDIVEIIRAVQSIAKTEFEKQCAVLEKMFGGLKDGGDWTEKIEGTWDWVKLVEQFRDQTLMTIDPLELPVAITNAVKVWAAWYMKQWDRGVGLHEHSFWILWSVFGEQILGHPGVGEQILNPGLRPLQGHLGGHGRKHAGGCQREV